MKSKQQRGSRLLHILTKGANMMKHRIFRRAAAILCATLLGCTAAGALPVSADSAALADSGISYQESTETLLNPGMGYTTTLWYRCKPHETTPRSPSGSLVLMFIDIGAFSSGENGTKSADGTYTPGTDYPLDEEFFSALGQTFENCRNNGSTIALRFRYDDDGTKNPEPATFDMLKTHIKQIGDSGLLEKYQDILMFVESGFVGCYGEQWGGKYCSLEQKAELLDLMLDIVPDPVPVTVRTPNIFAKWAGIGQKDLADWVSEPGSRAARVGMYDDGYMGSDSDLGTYSDRTAETGWLGRQAVTSCFGGEFSGNLEFAQKYDTYLPENAIPEMYRTHLTYINSNIFGLYDNYTFGADCDVPDADNSAYYGQTVRKFIRDHLGYRFVLREAKLSKEVEQGGELQINFKVENTGFANPVRQQNAEILLEKGGEYYRTPVSLDSRKWYSCTEKAEFTAAQIPGGIEPGKWNVYLKLSVGRNDHTQTHMRSVRFANPDIWQPALGANYIGSVTVKASDDPEKRTFHGFGASHSVDRFTLNGLQLTDGAPSYENEQGKPAAENDTAAIWLHQDAQNLYVTARYHTGAAAEVHNLHFKNQSNGENYWIYFASNGYVYFNHGEPTGVLQKHSDGLIEIQIPFGDVMGLAPGVTISDVRYALQDSANEWVVSSDITAKEPYTLEDSITVYNTLQRVSLQGGTSYTMTVLSDAKNAAYQWYHDGKPIDGAASALYTVDRAAAAAQGVYSVRIRKESGAERTVDICKIEKVYGKVLRGDADGDGAVEPDDHAALLDYLLTKSQTLRNPEGADLDGDGRLTAADLTLLRTMLEE